MIKFAKIVNEETKACDVGTGTNIDFYRALGFEEMDVEQAYNGQWYLKGYAPEKPATTLEEQVQELESKYNMPRVIREGILANPSAYSDFNVNRAKEIELLAEELRKESAEGNVL